MGSSSFSHAGFAFLRPRHSNAMRRQGRSMDAHERRSCPASGPSCGVAAWRTCQRRLGKRLNQNGLRRARQSANPGGPGDVPPSRREPNSAAAAVAHRLLSRCGRCCAERARPARPFDTATAGRPAETRHPCGPLSLRRPGTSPGMKRAVSNGPRRQSGAGRAPRPAASVVIGQSHVIR
jgi:hypothetical protein